MSINNSNDTTTPPPPHGFQHAATPSSQTLIQNLHNRLTTALQQPLLPISPHISAIISLLQHLCSNLPTPTSLPTPLYARACHAYAEQSLILLVRVLRGNFYGREMRMQPYRRHLTNIRPEGTGDTRASLAMRKWLIIEHLNVALSEPLSVSHNLGAAGQALQIICSTGPINNLRYARTMYALPAVPEQELEAWKDEMSELAVSALWTIQLFVSHCFGGEAVNLRLGPTSGCNCRQCQGLKVRRALEEAEEREREKSEEGKDGEDASVEEKGQRDEIGENEIGEVEEGEDELGEDEVGKNENEEDGWVEDEWVRGPWVQKSGEAKGEKEVRGGEGRKGR